MKGHLYISARKREKKKREEEKNPPCAQVALIESAWQDASNVALEGVVWTTWRA